MEEFIRWCAFLGAWLLVAGPIYQAIQELKSEDIERDVLVTATEVVGPPKHTSPWWWLIPPVAWWLRQKRQRDYQLKVALVLDDEEYASLLSFVNKAWGWLVVGLGAFLIAIKETWELFEHREWSHGAYVATVVGMLVLCFFHSAAREAHDARAQRMRAAGITG
ncbi:hypothetical protein [Nocardioides sp. Kera G14]|uniref:hypothetical protein n=1 Tax=Nocardioides sp. Kera G14 TaxID=2884264 RepID=UPI001D12969C|nr:hypothetical protein [Nocardioides sp. Kera G14]UDY24445.1 hypothetical protein LH076_03850 [Nocardioides sp. Kera G14]